MKTRKLSSLAVIVILVLLLGLAFKTGLALDPPTVRVSVSTGGGQSNNQSIESSISADGRYIAFSSLASNLVENDTNGKFDIFVHDISTNQTARVSVSSDRTQGDGDSRFPSISADGRFVAFMSFSSNLVPGDINGTSDVFVHDKNTGETSRVSVTAQGSGGNHPSISGDGRYVAFMSDGLVPEDITIYGDIYVLDRETGSMSLVSVASDGTQGNWNHYYPSISADGRYVAFSSGSVNLVPDDTNGMWDMFVHDRTTRETVRVSVASDGTQGNGHVNNYPSISANGRYVAFQSTATNLVTNDNNNQSDVFVHKLETQETVRVSVSSTGDEGNGASATPVISSDGKYIAFVSNATNLIPNDTNLAAQDVFVHNLLTVETSIASLAHDNNQGNSWSNRPSISSDGRYISFASDATNLVVGDTNNTSDIFVRDRGEEIVRNVLNVVSFMQGITPFDNKSPYWEGHIFGNADKESLGCGETMAQCGCSTTSLAMVLNYMGADKAPIANPVALQTDPGTLNYYFQLDQKKVSDCDKNTEGLQPGWASRGYYCGGVNWQAAAKYTRDAYKMWGTQKVVLRNKDGYVPWNPALYKEDIISDTPVILKVPGPTHWVVGTGYVGSTYTINDPYYADRTTLDNTAYGNKALTMVRYVRTESDFSFITIASINQILVTAPDGKRTGFDPDLSAVIEEIPGSSYYFESAVSDPTGENPPLSDDQGAYWLMLPTPSAGDYKVQVIAKNGDDYNFALYSYDKDANYELNIAERMDSPSANPGYIFRYDPTPGQPSAFIWELFIPIIYQE